MRRLGLGSVRTGLLAFFLSVLVGPLVASCGTPEEIASTDEALGACVLTEIPCTMDSECARTCGAGTCDLTGRCRVCALDAGTSCRASTGSCDVAEVCDGTTFDCPTDRFATPGTVCRASTGTCDVGEVCSGTSAACPADAFAPSSTTCRAAAGACDVAESCTGTSAACPADVRVTAGTTCRPAVAGGCDVAESCDGTSAACPANVFQPAGTMCRAQNGACDVADTCTGTSATCTDARAPAGTSCRASTGLCDVGEVCDGTASTCPADGFAPASTVCRASVGSCDRAESCTGTSAACPADAFQASGTTCRAAAGTCDVAETCTGTSTACPADTLRAAGFTCRALAGSCDIAAEVCSGTSAACPADMLQPNGTVCRPAAGPCDRAESCNGTSGACPADGFLNTVCRASTGACDPQEICTGAGPSCPADTISAAGTVCRAATAPCDAPETCDGVAVTCPAAGTNVQPAGTVCRAAVAGGCDVAESCDGVATTCPADVLAPAGTMCRTASGACDVADFCTGTSTACTNGFAAAGTSCRAAAGPCDRAETCSGTAAACPADTRQPAGTVCRPGADLCDAAETCSGTSNACPADALSPGGTVCRAAIAPCDRPETCSGTSAACPADAVQPAGSVCRSTAGACDVAELCDGTTTACPANAFANASTVCRAAAGTCDLAENCSGTSASCPADATRPAGTQCRASAGPCDVAESCAGGTAACPSDSFAPTGTSCDPDGTLCNGTRTCNAGTCGASSAPLDCDDHNPCTADSCDPVTGCRNTPVALGTGCDDGQYCTTGDVCRAGGVCRGDPRDCGPASDTCLITECDEAADRCIEAPNPSGVPCQGVTPKPHMMVILDNSGTMSASTGSGTNSCAHERTRISDAKCVLSNVVSSYGDIVFGLERFTQTTSGSCTSTCGTCSAGGTCPTTCSSCNAQTLDCGSCDPSAASPGAGSCPATGGAAAQGEILTPLVEDNQPEILRWVDYSCNTCSRTGTNPELTAGFEIYTPIAGSLRAARRYFEGGDPSFPSPIDPTNTCTPYYVILITDGTEACTTYTDAIAAATELRTTHVGSAVLDVHTYTIGVGIDPSSFNGMRLRDIATAGGTTPYFASDESSIALAFAQILEDSLLVETCNGADDDCDTRIDEGFTLYCDLTHGHTDRNLCDDPGDPCDGEDDNCARGILDEVHNACGVCGATPVEVCDRVDNDCDGMVDEPPADCSCIAEPEVCDGRDNDCDGTIDDGLTRPCGSDVGVCTRGTQTCAAGAWGTCSGTVPGTEICNGLDDDCDGVVDGFTRVCGPAAVGVCGPGVEVCTAGAWGACTGASLPGTEYCNGLDDDCDGTVDESDTALGTSCDTTCGAGEIRCVAGSLACVATGSSMLPELCNAYDDDCDGNVDEGVASRGPCDGGGLLCILGEEQCVGGVFTCVGGSPPEAEICDCLDNDCNRAVDDAVSCGDGGATCLGAPYCTCARPCTMDEFPCPTGFRCTPPTDPFPSFCVHDECFGVTCDPDSHGLRTCVAGDCVSICDTVDCPTGRACNPQTGACVPDDCYGFPDRCTGGAVCVAGECDPNRCTGVTCGAGDFCRDGTCITSCADVHCVAGQRCEDGACVVDRCAGVSCTSDEVCDPASGQCVPDLCTSVTCPANTVCEAISGHCVRNPCLGVTCPESDATCENGECVAMRAFDAGSGGMADGGEIRIAAIGGAGNCACRAGRGARPTGALAGLLALLLVIAARRGRSAR